MRLLFYGALSTIVLGLLARIPVGGAGILALDLLAPIIGGGWFLFMILSGKTFPRIPFIFPILIFVFWAFITWIIGAYELPLLGQVMSFSYLVRILGILLLGGMAGYLYQNDPVFTRNFWRNFWIIVSVTLGIAVLQFYFIPDIGRWSTEGGFDPHTGRLLGTWMDPNFLGGFIGFLLPMAISFFYQSNAPRQKAFYAGLIGLLVFCLFLTFSRSAYLSSVIGLFLFFIIRDPRMILVGIVCCILGVLSSERSQKRLTELGGTLKAVIFFDTDEIDPTAKLRIVSWQKSFELFQKYPVAGIGYNTYRYRAAEEGIVDENYFSAGGADSTFLTLLVTTGVVGGILFLWFIGQLWIQNFWLFLRTRQEIYLGFCAGILSLFIHSTFVNSLLFPLIFLPVIVVGCVLAGKNTTT